MRPYLVLILICSAILTGCNSEEKAQVRRNKVQIDAEWSQLVASINDFIEREKDTVFESDRWARQESKFASDIAELDRHYAETWNRAYQLGIFDELYPKDYKGRDETLSFYGSKTDIVRALHESVALRAKSPREFQYWICNNSVLWKEFSDEYDTREAMKILRERFGKFRYGDGTGYPFERIEAEVKGAF